jgi:hypothetical protein
MVFTLVWLGNLLCRIICVCCSPRIPILNSVVVSTGAEEQRCNYGNQGQCGFHFVFFRSIVKGAFIVDDVAGDAIKARRKYRLRLKIKKCVHPNQYLHWVTILSTDENCFTG